MASPALAGCSRTYRQLVVELRRQAEHRGHAIGPEPDEEDHLAVAEPVVLGDDVERFDIERRQPLEFGRALLEGLEIVACAVVVFGVHLLDGGEDLAFTLADRGRRNRSVAIKIGGAVLLDERPNRP